MGVALVVEGRLSGSRNQMKKMLGPLVPSPSGAGRYEKAFAWACCSMYGSSGTSGPTAWVSLPGRLPLA